nr:alpha/beta hydrolase [uncultured Eisenbergiella sp.]
MALFDKSMNVLKKNKEQEQNQNLMKLIKRVHSVVENTDIEKHRQSQDYFGALLGNSKDMDICSVEVEGMHCEWVRANRVHMKKYVILYCHGGGYSTGSCIYARTLTTKLAASTSMDVFCFDYRLAPEYPYPAAMEDAMKAWNYLMLLGYGAKDVIVVGDSAGGNMALSLVVKLKEETRLVPRGIVLLSPWTDLTASGKTHESRAEVDPVLDEEYLKQMTENYAAGQDYENPQISPLFADLTGFPPTYIQVGDNEVLLSDATMLHKKMIKANVPVRLDVFKGMWHVFQMSPFKTAYEAMDQCAEFIFDICR